MMLLKWRDITIYGCYSSMGSDFTTNITRLQKASFTQDLNKVKPRWSIVFHNINFHISQGMVHNYLLGKFYY